jgi:hypothetical protein
MWSVDNYFGDLILQEKERRRRVDDKSTEVEQGAILTVDQGEHVALIP